MTESLKIPTQYELREDLQEMVIRDLLGPVNGEYEEVAETRVSERYLVGMLAPRNQPISPEEYEEQAIGGPPSGEDGSTDSDAIHNTKLLPSSIGMTFCIENGAKEFQVTAQWGFYDRVGSETEVKDDLEPKIVWKRTPVEGKTIFPLKAGAIPRWSPSPDFPDVIVCGQIRQTGDNGWIVTLFLVNQQEEIKRLRDKAWVFQPVLIVEAGDGRPIFFKNPLRYDSEKLDVVAKHELKTLAMLYRRQVEFAVGHGVSVHAESDPANPQRARRIQTRVLPILEVPIQQHNSPEKDTRLSSLALDMKELAETLDHNELVDKLASLPAAYAQWIADEQAKIADPQYGLDAYLDVASDALKNCRKAMARIQEGIDLLKNDLHAAEAFRFANRAMWSQRIHTIYTEKKRRGEELTLEAIDLPDNRRWRLFQVGFILLNLPSVTDLHHPYRSGETEACADLLWFPTGGGKTEAYLGLTAYVLGLRRLQGDIEGRSGEYGMAVLMRYTLRLLTLQQFQRAAALICACEVIRREQPEKWGAYPFRLGLWVGYKVTPNKKEDSQYAIENARDRDHILSKSGSPAQLTYCPWCGSELKLGRDIEVNDATYRTISYCSDSLGRCLFNRKHSPDEGIPVLVVDEDIYRNPPSLLIATVDKFAQMPWNGAIQTLFGQVSGRCPRHGFRSPGIDDKDSHRRSGHYPAVSTEEHLPLRPPDLIIQDELHLINGPLGSLVGLYETAVDYLCGWKVDGKIVRPKIIASTATIRRAMEQIHQVFTRRVEIFPPQGTDIQNNFFSYQEEPNPKKWGRRYLGVCAPGKRIKAAQIRVHLAFLSVAQKLYEKYGEHIDPWMTLVGYFNSIRELGGARRAIDDDVRTRLRMMDRRGLAKRNIYHVEELTSRISGSRIPQILDALEHPFDPRIDKKTRKEKQIPYPIDVLLATNMISVGVDVGRLGLMAVTGQPKTTAEYIQATSRIGRSKPGLVCTIYNWARPRDTSHYETFEHYHSTFYQQVEALTVTPYSQGAIDRGLSGVLVSLIRLAEIEYNENKQAQHVDRNHYIVQRAIEWISNRGSIVKGNKNFQDELKNMLDSRVDIWMKEISSLTGGSRLGYQQSKDGLTLGLLQSPQMNDWDCFTCLNSLRDVEPSVGLILQDFSADIGTTASTAE